MFRGHVTAWPQNTQSRSLSEFQSASIKWAMAWKEHSSVVLQIHLGTCHQMFCIPSFPAATEKITQCSLWVSVVLLISSCADSYPFRTLLPGQLINHTMWTGCKHEVKEQLTWPSVCRSVCGQIKLSRDQFIIMNLAVSHLKLCWAQRTVATAAV